MAGRVAEVVAVSALAAIITAVIAAPVLRAPSDRVFGMELVGRHHDPFTVMEQFGRPIRISVYSQPVTDIGGALLARIAGPVAAYNWLILLSFPASAAAAYLLARHLVLSRAAAAAVAMAYAFSPFHMAQAAYHLHIAQTQWVPLYLLALWWCLDHASWAAVGFLGAATLGVTLSNFYGGLIAAVMTPIALAAYWLFTGREHPGSTRRLGITAGTLLLIAAAGAVYVRYAARAVVADPAAFASLWGDLFRYSARWSSYLVPPTEHPLLGAIARAFWQRVDVREGLLEQQLSLGWGIVALGLIAVVGWSVCVRTQARRPPSLGAVPILVIVAVAAFVCSLSPAPAIGPVTTVGPAALLYGVVPMFRSYARFGVVVQLMAVVLAGIGIDWLRRAGTTPARVACVALIAIAGAEYMVSPSAMWRDVLPAAGHRWAMQQVKPVRVLDCAPATRESASVQWLTSGRVTLLGGPIRDCADPNLSRALMANGYTHLLVGRNTADGQWFADHPAPDGLAVATRFDDGQLFAVAGEPPVIHTATMTGFFSRERDGEWAWRWMGADAAWTIVNAGGEPVGATLGLELSAFHRPRGLELRLDGRQVQTVVVQPSHDFYQLGPFTVGPGYHEIVFHPVDLPTVVSDVLESTDGRQLSFAVGMWNWSIQDEQP